MLISVFIGRLLSHLHQFLTVGRKQMEEWLILLWRISALLQLLKIYLWKLIEKTSKVLLKGLELFNVRR